MQRANLQNRGVSHKRLTRFSMLCLFFALFAARPIAAEPAAEPEAISEAEQRWVNAFVDYLYEGNKTRELINVPKLTRVALKPFQLDAKQLQFFDALPLEERLLTGVKTNIQGDTEIVFLRMREIEGTRTALFRFNGDLGMGYYEWLLEPTKGGEVVAWDCEVYMTGERMSETLRRLWLPAVVELDPEIRKHMGKKNRELADNFLKVIQLAKLNQARQFDQAVEVYESLPDSVKQERACLVQAMSAHFESGDEERYFELLEQFLELHGSASNRELMLMDVYISKEEYDKAMQMIDDLEKRVGGDAYCDFLRSNIAYMKGDYAKAKQYTDQGIERDPSIADLYWGAIEQAVAEQQWPRVTRMIEGLEAIGYEFSDLESYEYYQDYVKSDSYKQWRDKKAAPAE